MSDRNLYLISGTFLICFLVWGYMKFVRRPATLGGASYFPTLSPSQIKPAELMFGEPSGKLTTEKNPAGKKGCGCLL